MFRHIPKILLKVFPLIVFASFAWIAVFGVGMGMNMDENGNMSGCPLMAEQASVCPMGVVEHIAQWQQITTVVPNPYTSITLILLAIFAILSTLRSFHQSKILPSKLSIRFYKYKEIEVRASHPLLAAFSDGILNPRIY